MTCLAALVLLLAPAWGQTTAVTTQPVPAGTRGRVETEVLLKMDIHLEGGVMSAPMSVETERIAFWEFKVLEVAPGSALLDLHYVKCWTNEESERGRREGATALEGRRLQVRVTPGKAPEFLVAAEETALTGAEAVEVALDLDWIDELFVAGQSTAVWTIGQPYDQAALAPFIAALGPGAGGSLSSWVVGPSSVEGRPTLEVGFQTHASWQDAGIGVQIAADGVLEVDRGYGVGSRIRVRGPLVLSGQKSLQGAQGPYQAQVAGTGKLNLISTLELTPP